MALAVLTVTAGSFVSLRPPFCAPTPTGSRRCATPFLLFRPPPLPPPSAPPQGLSAESLSAIMELVHLDAQMVFDTFRREPKSALSLALQSVERRGPLLLWVAAYNVEKWWLRWYECLSNHSSLIGWTLGSGAVAEVAWRRSHAENSLARHRSRLTACLLVLRPELRQRVLQAAREQPQLIPSMTTRLARSAVYRVRWKLNYWKKVAGWRSEERFRDVRANLVEKLLDQAVWLHRRIQPWTGPTTTAGDVLRKYSQSTPYPPPSSSLSTRRRRKPSVSTYPPPATGLSSRRRRKPSLSEYFAWATSALTSAVTSAWSQAMHVAAEVAQAARTHAVAYMPALLVLSGVVQRLILVAQANFVRPTTQLLSLARVGFQQARAAGTYLLGALIGGRRTSSRPSY